MYLLGPKDKKRSAEVAVTSTSSMSSHPIEGIIKQYSYQYHNIIFSEMNYFRTEEEED